MVKVVGVSGSFVKLSSVTLLTGCFVMILAIKIVYIFSALLSPFILLTDNL